jgi:hypothetical protein
MSGYEIQGCCVSPSSDLTTFTLLFKLRHFRFVLIKLRVTTLPSDPPRQKTVYIVRLRVFRRCLPATFREFKQSQNLNMDIKNGALSRSL